MSNQRFAPPPVSLDPYCVLTEVFRHDTISLQQASQLWRPSRRKRNRFRGILHWLEKADYAPEKTGHDTFFSHIGLRISPEVFQALAAERISIEDVLIQDYLDELGDYVDVRNVRIRFIKDDSLSPEKLRLQFGRGIYLPRRTEQPLGSVEFSVEQEGNLCRLGLDGLEGQPHAGYYWGQQSLAVGDQSSPALARLSSLSLGQGFLYLDFHDRQAVSPVKLTFATAMEIKFNYFDAKDKFETGFSLWRSDNTWLGELQIRFDDRPMRLRSHPQDRPSLHLESILLPRLPKTGKGLTRWSLHIDHKGRLPATIKDIAHELVGNRYGVLHRDHKLGTAKEVPRVGTLAIDHAEVKIEEGLNRMTDWGRLSPAAGFGWIPLPERSVQLMPPQASNTFGVNRVNPNICDYWPAVWLEPHSLAYQRSDGRFAREILLESGLAEERAQPLQLHSMTAMVTRGGGLGLKNISKVNALILRQGESQELLVPDASTVLNDGDRFVFGLCIFSYVTEPAA